MTIEQVYEICKGREVYSSTYKSKGVIVGYTQDGYDLLIMTCDTNEGWSIDSSMGSDFIANTDPKGKYLYVNPYLVDKTLNIEG